MSLLSTNLSALAGVLGAPPRLPTSDGRVRLAGSSDVPVLSLSTPSGGVVALNSRRDPLREAVGLLEAALTGGAEPEVIVTVGLGLGFIIDAIELKYPATRIVALEPEPGCVGPLLERRDLTALLSERRLLLLWGPEYVGISEAWKFFGNGIDAPPIVRHPVLCRENPESFEAALKIVAQMVFGARSNAEARRKFAGRYLLNTLRNVPTIARSADVGALFGAFSDVPGIIVSAGPSLDTNLADLAVVTDRAVVIAVDTALRPLLSAKVNPHVVVGVDPSDVNAGHFQDLPATAPTYLIAEGSLDPAAFAAFGDRVFTFKVSDHEPWPWLRALGLDRATLRAWGSVATSAFDLALRLGCNPIVFVGQDLAYTNGQPHCRGTTFETSWAEFAIDGTALAHIWRKRGSADSWIRMPDINGEPTFTTPLLVAFRNWLVEQCGQRVDRRFVNATGAGILMGPRLEQSSLSAAIPPLEKSLDPFAILAAARHTNGGVSERIEAAIHALLRDFEGTALPAVIETWRDFTAQTVTPEEVRAVLVTASTARSPRAPEDGIVRLSGRSLGVFTRLTGLGSRRALPSTSRLPERAAGIQAVAQGRELPNWTTTTIRDTLPSPHDADLRTVIETATRALCRVLSLPDPVRGLVPGHETLAPVSDALSLTAPFDWHVAARSDVDLIEHAVRLASGLTPMREGAGATDTFRWSVAPSMQPPFSERGEALPVPRDVMTWWARRALVIEWAGLLKALPMPATGELADLIVHLAEWLRDLADGPVPVSLDESNTALEGRLEGADGDRTGFRFELRTPPWRLMRALTGAITRATGRVAATDGTGREDAPAAVEVALPAEHGRRTHVRCAIVTEPARLSGINDPRIRFFHRRDAWVAPTVLVLPRAYMASRLDDSTALVTPHHERRSWAVDASGHLTPLQEWPYPILGERRGTGTSGVAWSNVGSGYLMRRASDTAAVETAVPPFRPIRAVMLEDGTSLWCGTTGGLWTWAANGSIECVVPTPPLCGVTVDPRGIRLDPMSTDGGSAHRRVLTRGWHWRRDTRVLEEIDLGPLGQMSSRADADDRWAAAHSAADTIRLGERANALWDLACDAPHDVAWAGDSLVVTSRHGTVLLFRNLAQVLASDR